jgi:outer membrane receptor protein involved in Fe transport
LLLPLSVLCLSVHGQEYEPDADEELIMEEVVVTGSRIKRRDYTSPSPLTTVGRDDLEFSGQPTLEEYLNQMPQVQPDLGRTGNNPGDGTARLNLRALGPGRTLVLLNGRRIAPSGVESAVDVNNLPRALIDRVEIITGGASTVYGSDAIAGVVNFITRQDFEGLTIDGSYSVSAEGDSDIYDANLGWGMPLAGGAGNLTLHAGYYERKPTFGSERELTSKVWVDTWQGELDEGGSQINPGGLVYFPSADYGSGPARTTWDPDGTPRAFNRATDLFNYAPYNYLQIPLTRYSVGLMGHVPIGTDFEAYFEAAYARNEARQNLAHAPAFEFFVINTDNPVLTPETRTLFEEQMAFEPGFAGILLGRRMLELGLRILDTERDYTRLVAGLRGTFAGDWDVDAWVTWTDADGINPISNSGSLSLMAQGLLVDPATNQCFDPSNGCVPVDIFGEGRLTPEAAEFIRLPPLINTFNRTQYLASVVVTGAPFDIWSGPLDMAFGAEWRRDEASFAADDILFTGDAMGLAPRSAVLGTESVYELYAEALLPLIDGWRDQYLGLELGGRFSNYRNAGSVWTYKAGLEWQPLDALRLRTMIQRAVRAPNNAELFTEQTSSTGWWVGENFEDPCSASQNPVQSGNAEKCILQGLPADQIGVFEAEPFYPVTYTNGGNPDLVPEESDTLTVGVVITPEAVPDLVVSIDYFDMEVTDTIGEINPDLICFDPLNTANLFCENLQRDATGNVSEFLALTSNRGVLATEGYDVQAQYAVDLPAAVSLFDDYSRLTVNAYWTHVRSLRSQENVITEVLECVGLFGWPCASWDVSGYSFPENRLITNFDYATGPLNLRFSWRWIDGMDNAAPLGSANFGFPDPDLAVPSVPSYNYFDLGLGYNITDDLIVRFGINNLLNEDPPQMADSVNPLPNTDTRLYDVFGRTYFLSFAWTLLD